MAPKVIRLQAIGYRLCCLLSNILKQLSSAFNDIENTIDELGN